MKIKTILLLLLGVLAIFIFFQNTETVSFKALFWQITMPRIFWFLIILGVGMFIGYVMQPLLKKLFKQ